VKALGGPEGKASMYELGFRTPVIFHWPGHLAPGRRDDLVAAVDLFTTLLDVAGVEAPPDRTGVSLRPALMGEAPSPRKSIVGGMSQLRPPVAVEEARANPAADIVRSERAWFVRNAEWHYIWYEDSARYPDRSPDELYHIEEDPWELHDVAAEHPDVVRELRAEIGRWRRDVEARVRAGI
jgi:uncharacterized sulfatase